MKKIILIAALALIALPTVNAQVTNTEPTVPGLTSTLGDWLASYNTNLTFQDAMFWDGPVYLDGVNLANEFGASLDLWRSKPIKNGGRLFAGVEVRLRQANIDGLNLSQAGGGEFGWMKYDVRIGIFGDAVYLPNPEAAGTSKRVVGEFGIFADKMISKSIATGIFISQQMEQKKPFIGVNLNVSFGNGTGLLGLF